MIMTHQTPQSILSLPPGTSSPEAYRVLGLSVFEADRAKIKVAIESTFARLKDAKGNSESSAWETAVQWAKNAQVVLGDASKKAAYDRKLAAEHAARPPVFDPLAGVLPDAVNSGAAHPEAAKPAAFHPGQGARSTPPTFDPLGGALPSLAGPTYVPASPVEATIPVVRNRTSGKRRSRVPWLPIFLSLFCLGAIAGLGGLVLVLQRTDPIVINTSGGPLIGSAADPDGDGRVVGPPGYVAPAERRPHDPVMGGLAGDMPPPQPPELIDESGQPLAADVNPSSPDMSMPDMPPPEMAMPTQPTPEIPGTDAPVPMPESTPEQIQAGEAAIAAVVDAIKQHDWIKLKPLAEKADLMAVNDLQKEQATMLYQLVDLATFYRGGIEKGLTSLHGGNELDLSPGVKVAIVEAGPDNLIIQHNGKNRPYTLDTMPLLIAHKLAKLSLPADSPTNQAAMYAFQAITPITIAEYREAAIKSLEMISAEVEGADPAKLVAAIRLVYP